MEDAMCPPASNRAFAHCPVIDGRCPWTNYFDEPYWVDQTRKSLQRLNQRQTQLHAACGVGVNRSLADTLPCGFLFS